jgi:SAM-dependent methyltransferase
LVGNELLQDRAAEAKARLPSATRLVVGDATVVDFGSDQFDVVYQSTVFTSILDEAFQTRLAAKMWTLVKPGGYVLWYDFVYDNPKNPDVKGVSIDRIRVLFPEGKLGYLRLTLAPPISRLVSRLHPRLYDVFNALPLLRTHVFCWIQKPENT